MARATHQRRRKPPVEMPPGRREARSAVILGVKERGVATAATLSKCLGMPANTVRYHLRQLESEGVLSHQLVRHGVGAPAYAYRLSGSADHLFPDHSGDTVGLLLDRIVALQGRHASVEMLRGHFTALAERVCRAADAAEHASRAEMITAALNREGFVASWVAAGEGGMLTEHNCPHRTVAERFPEVCEAEEQFLARAFGAGVRRESRIAGGCGCCRYQVLPRAKNEESA